MAWGYGDEMEATTSAAPASAKYRNFHLWMLLPFGISVLGVIAQGEAGNDQF